MPVSKGRKKAKKKPPPPRPTAKAAIKAKGPSPTWYITLMFGLIAVGSLAIILNYMGLLPGGTDTKYLVIGLVGIAAGFAMTLNFR